MKIIFKNIKNGLKYFKFINILLLYENHKIIFKNSYQTNCK